MTCRVNFVSKRELGQFAQEKIALVSSGWDRPRLGHIAGRVRQAETRPFRSTTPDRKVIDEI